MTPTAIAADGNEYRETTADADLSDEEAADGSANAPQPAERTCEIEGCDERGRRYRVLDDDGDERRSGVRCRRHAKSFVGVSS